MKWSPAAFPPRLLTLISGHVQRSLLSSEAPLQVFAFSSRCVVESGPMRRPLPVRDLGRERHCRRSAPPAKPRGLGLRANFRQAGARWQSAGILSGWVFRVFLSAHEPGIRAPFPPAAGSPIRPLLPVVLPFNLRLIQTHVLAPPEKIVRSRNRCSDLFLGAFRRPIGFLYFQGALPFDAGGSRLCYPPPPRPPVPRPPP